MIIIIVVVLAVGGVIAALSLGSSEPFASGTPTGEGFACGDAYLTWTTNNGHLHGTIAGPAGQSINFHGTQTGDELRLITPSSSEVGRAKLSGTTLVIEPGNLKCALKTRQAWLASKSVSQPPSADYDRAAESDVTNALTSAKAEYANTNQYPSTATLVAQLAQMNPTLQFTAGPATGATQISVSVAPGGQALVLAARSAPDGRCWYAGDNEQQTADDGLPSGTTFNASARSTQQSACSAASLAPLAGPWREDGYPR